MPHHGTLVSEPFGKVSERVTWLRRSNVTASEMLVGGDGPSEDIGKGFVQLDEEEDAEFDGIVHQDGKIIVSRCNRTVTFNEPTAVQSYFAMLSLSGKDTMGELRNTRCRMLWLLGFGIFFEAFLNCIQPLIDSGLGPPGYQKVPDGNGDAPLSCKVICKGLGTMLSKFLTLQSQMAVLSLFNMYWVHHDHYITSFIPGKAFIFTYCFYAFLGCALPAVFRCGLTENLPYCILCIVLFYIGIIGFPMTFGYNLYQFQYLWKTGLGQAVEEDIFHGVINIDVGEQMSHKVVETEWTGDMEASKKIFDWMFGVHASEVVLSAVMELMDGLCNS